MSSAAASTGYAAHLAVHEFLDVSKSACADRRHRIVLHQVDLGADIARQAFPTVADTDALVDRHVEEDLGRPATCCPDRPNAILSLLMNSIGPVSVWLSQWGPGPSGPPEAHAWQYDPAELTKVGDLDPEHVDLVQARFPSVG